MRRIAKNDARQKKNAQEKSEAFLGVVEALDSRAAAETFRKAYPDHALSKPFKSKKQARRHGKR